MLFQPHEKPGSKNHNEEFINLNDNLKMYIYLQPDRTLNSLNCTGASSPINEQIAINDFGKNSTETTQVQLEMVSDEPLFSEGILGEAEIMDTFTEPISEVTDATTPPEAEIHNLPPDVDVASNATENAVEGEMEKPNLRSINTDTQRTLLRVVIQPTKDPRRRYQSEGKRRMKKIQSDLLTLDVSKLQQYSLTSNQKLWIRLALITHSDDPSAPIYIHPDMFEDLSKKARKQIDGSLYVRIPQSMIDQGKIEFRDLTIIRRLDKAYTFKLIPYNTSTINSESDPYVKDDKKRTSGNAKIFREKFNVKASRIACQLIIKEDGVEHFTDITCLTDVMIEQKYERKERKPTKRMAKNKRKVGKKRPNTIKSKPMKRSKRFN